MDTSLLSQPHRPGVGHAADAASGLDQPDLHEQFPEFRRRRFLFAAGHFDYFSGAERQAVYFAGELVKQLQADVRFIGWGGNGRFADEIRAVGAEPVVYPLDPSLGTWRTRFELISLANYIRRELRPDFLLPYVWMHCRILGAIWPWTGARFCWWNQRDEGRGIEGTWLERRLMKTLPAIVSNSWEGRDFLTRKFGLQQARVQVINNGVVVPVAGRDLTWRMTHGLAKGAFVISMLANLTRFKDHLTLLKAFATACMECDRQDLHLVLAGSHEEMTEPIRQMARDLRMQHRIHLPGSVKDSQSLLRATDLVVHSSVTEGCPNGVLEPMALGLPVVGTDISGLRQAIGSDAASNVLSNPGDFQTLASLIVERVRDVDLRNAEGHRNRQRIIEHFSLNGMAAQSLKTIQCGLACL